MSYVLIVTLFVKQNILILFKRNPRVTKTSHMWKNLLIFFFCILIIDIFYFWRCSTKGAAHGSWYIKVCIFWKCIQYTVNLDKTQMSKKFPSDKINGPKNTLFFLSRAATRQSFTFNFWFLNEVTHKVRLSKTVCRIFYFWFRFVFIKVYIFVQQKALPLWL